MRLDRLQKVVDALKNVKENEFDMDCWYKETACGTVACAAGHYALANPDCGIRLLKDNAGLWGTVENGSSSQGSYGGALLESHFELTEDDVYNLFYGQDSRLNVIKRFETFIKENK